MTIEEIARLCHHANKAICEAAGDMSQVGWEQAAAWQRESAIAGVKWALAHPDASPGEQHAAWLAHKLADGWRLGPVKDAEAKVHPAMVPFEALPLQERMKDHVFRAVVANA